MGEYFQAGGMAMYVISIWGLAALCVGVLAARRPTPGKLAALKNLPSLIMATGLAGYATGLWRVGKVLTDPEFVKSRGISGDQLPLIGWLGMGESCANLTWSAMFVTFVIVLRMVAEIRLARARGA